MNRFVLIVTLALLAASLASPVLAAPGIPVPPDPSVKGPPELETVHPPIIVRHGPSLLAIPPYTPQQVRHAYGFDSASLSNYNGNGQIIGIVDAYNDPNAANDLNTFITQFGLSKINGVPGQPSCTVASGPHPCFQKVYAQSQPRSDGGWAMEISLDVQWAHSIAPGADILLVEARSASFSNLLGAVDVAVNKGARVVSMSWGGGEFMSESNYDYHFNHPGVVFTAASGDSGNGTIYPAVSPYVVAVGGTTMPLDGSGNLTSAETAWNGSGGGTSLVESEPAYQSSYSIPSTGGMRGSPDVSYNADPNTGYYVYSSTPYYGQSGWWVVGGTSAGAPQWAALFALADQGRPGNPLSSNSLSASAAYTAAKAAYASNYRDVTTGSNGSCTSACQATAGYDLVTGLGSPLAGALVPYLIGQ